MFLTFSWGLGPGALCCRLRLMRLIVAESKPELIPSKLQVESSRAYFAFLLRRSALLQKSAKPTKDYHRSRMIGSARDLRNSKVARSIIKPGGSVFDQ